MSRKIIKVVSIKPLKDSQTGQKRYSLFENRSNFCVFTKNDTNTLPAVGSSVIAIEQDITLADGTAARGWYYVEEFTNAAVKLEANRDFDHKVAMAKDLQSAAQALKIRSLSMEEVSKMIEI